MMVGARKYRLRRPKAREDSCSDGEQSVPPGSAPAIGKREQEKIVTRAFACSSSAAGGSRTAVFVKLCVSVRSARSSKPGSALSSE